MSRQFELSAWTRCTITNVNLRNELHGDQHVPAVDVALQVSAPNDILLLLDEPLKLMLYGKPDPETRAAQAELDGVEATSDMPKLRSVLLAPLKLKNEYVGYTLTIDRGLGGSSNLVLEGCGVAKFSADCKEGGTVDLAFRVQAAHVESETIGKLAVMIGAEASIRLEAPAVQEALAA